MEYFDHSDELDELISSIQSLEDELSAVIAAGSDTPETQLRLLDKKLSREMERLYEFRVYSTGQMLRKTKFLLDRVNLFTEHGSAANTLARKVNDELINFMEHVRSGGVNPEVGEYLNSASSARLVEVCYSSTALSDFSEIQLEELCQLATESNLENNISGMLTYDDKQRGFYQILEGEPHAVWRLMKSIIGDERHTDVVVHFQSHIVHRTFADWSMRFVGSPELASSVQNITNLDDWFGDLLATGRSSIGRIWISAALKRIYSQTV